MQNKDIQSTWLLSPEDEIDLRHCDSTDSEINTGSNHKGSEKKSSSQSEALHESSNDGDDFSPVEPIKIRERPLLLNNETENPRTKGHKQSCKLKVTTIANTLIAIIALSLSAYTTVNNGYSKNTTNQITIEKIFKLTEQAKIDKLQIDKIKQELEAIKSSSQIALENNIKMNAKLHELKQQLTNNAERTKTNQEKINKFKKVEPISGIIPKSIEHTKNVASTQTALPKHTLITQVVNSIDSVLLELN